MIRILNSQPHPTIVIVRHRKLLVPFGGIEDGFQCLHSGLEHGNCDLGSRAAGARGAAISLAPQAVLRFGKGCELRPQLDHGSAVGAASDKRDRFDVFRGRAL